MATAAGTPAHPPWRTALVKSSSSETLRLNSASSPRALAAQNLPISAARRESSEMLPSRVKLVWVRSRDCDTKKAPWRYRVRPKCRSNNFETRPVQTGRKGGAKSREQEEVPEEERRIGKRIGPEGHADIELHGGAPESLGIPEQERKRHRGGGAHGEGGESDAPA